MTVHIATSEDLGRVVRRGLRESVCFMHDNWLVGPCARNAELHARARCDYWALQGQERSRFLGSFHDIIKAIDSRQFAVIWMSRLGSDTVAFWALCAWRLLRWPRRPNLGLAILGGPAEAEDPSGVGGGSIHVTPAGVRRALVDMSSLSITRVREMALFWRKVSGHAPILWAQASRTTSERKKLFELGVYQSAFFPRLTAHGLVLSRFDELLFSCIGEQWLTPLDVFMHRGATGEELRKLADFTGDVLLSVRLAQWASHNGSDAALRSEPYQAENIMKDARYRLSDIGHAIKCHGLTGIAQGPPLPAWGVVAYDPMAPWVVVEEPAGRHRFKRL